MNQYQWKHLINTAVIVGLLILFIGFQHPILRSNPYFEQIVAPMRDKLHNEPPEYRAAAAMVTQSENQTIYHVEGDQYKTRIEAESKAQAAMFSDPTVYKNVWGAGGDGLVDSNGDYWSTTGTTVTMYYNPSYTRDSFFSFNIGTTFQDTNNVKSIYDIEFNWYVQSETLEGTEWVRVKAFETNLKAGLGGNPYIDSAEEIARGGSSARPLQSGESDTQEFTKTGWDWMDLPYAWIAPGDSGYLTIYLYPYSGWDNFPADEVKIYTGEAGGYEPYLEISYTLWSAPVANAVDITDEPTYLLPGQDYEVKTIISDVDGRTNLNKGFLYISEDHTTYRVRFDWTRSSDNFTQGEGASYVTLNVSASSSVEYGANGYQLTWNFTATRDWKEGSMDWANSANDAQGKTTANWNNLNTWYTDRLWVHSISVYWISEETYLEDSDGVNTDQSLNITGYIYWYSTTQAYDLGFGTPITKLFIDGSDEGATYNDSIASNGFYNISYTTPLVADWSWALDIELGIIPTGMSEGPSNDDGKSPLYLIYATQAIVTVTMQPNPMIPTATVQTTQIDFGMEDPWGPVLLDDNTIKYVTWVGTSKATYDVMAFYWEIGYPLALKQLVYAVDIDAGGGTNNHIFEIYQRDGTTDNIFNVGSTKPVSGTWSTLDETYWISGRVGVRLYFLETATAVYNYQIDQMIIEFDPINEIHILDVYTEGTEELQQVKLPVLQDDVNITLSDISKDYTIRSIHPAVSYEDNISTDGTLKLINVVKGSYEVIFRTGRTSHILHMASYAADGVGLEWERFKWYMNETRIPYPPEYELYSGNYTITIKDFYGETVATGDVKIPSSDPRHVYAQVGLDFYMFTLGNWDRQNYYVLVKRSGFTANYSLSSFPCSISFYMYGSLAGIDYEFEFYQTTDEGNVLNKTISMKTHADSYTIDYIAGDEIPEVAAPAGAAVIYELDILIIILAITAVFGLNLFNTYRQESARKKAKPKKKKPKPTDVVSISRELKEKAKKEKERSKDYEKS